MTSLFRKESLQAEQQPMYAKPLAVKPVTATLIMWVLLGIILLLIGFSSIAQYDKKERVTGYLMTEEGDAPVYVPVTGVITEVHVKEGALIKKGDPLFSISTEVGAGTGNTGEQVSQQLMQKKTTLESDITHLVETTKLEKQQLTQKLRSLNDSLLQAKESLVRLRSIAMLSQTALDKQRELLAKGYISELGLVDKQRDKLEIDARISSSMQSLLSQERERAQLSFELSTLDRRLESASLAKQRELLTISQSLTELTASRVRKVMAATDGEVVGLLVAPGSAVSAGELLFRVAKVNSKLVAKLKLTSRVRGTIKAGQPVLLQYDAFPYRDFGQANTRIVSVSAAPFDSQEQNRLRESKEPIYMATAYIDSPTVTSRKNETFKLTSGMTFQADVIIERRSLLAWLFSPLLDAWNAS